jgi:hypothetical protein
MHPRQFEGCGDAGEGAAGDDHVRAAQHRQTGAVQHDLLSIAAFLAARRLNGAAGQGGGARQS